MPELNILIPLLIVGCIGGFLAGLLGVGGGLIIVPVIVWVLHASNFDGEHIQQIAVGTSLAVMVFTSFSSVLAQHKKGAVRWDIVKGMAPAMVIGTLIGSAIAGFVPSKALQWFFVIFAYLVALQSALKFAPKATRQMPGLAGRGVAGTLIGVVSSWVGIGGGSMSVPFMSWCNVPIRNAIGTSAALGWPIAFSGAIGYIVSGLSVKGLPAGSWGFVYMPSALTLIVATTLCAPLGVKVAHTLPPAKLKIAFGLLLFTMATQMAWNLLTG